MPGKEGVRLVGRWLHVVLNDSYFRLAYRHVLVESDLSEGSAYGVKLGLSSLAARAFW